MTDATELRDTLMSAIGHYMTVVAEKLLGEGLPVISIHSYTGYDQQSDQDTDAEGGIDFSEAFYTALLPGSEATLHWNGASGWCLCAMYKDRELFDKARWLGAGLTPSAERVAAFVSTIRLDPHNAGSGERPYYRDPWADLPGLLARLAPFAPRKELYEDYEYRFRSVQGHAYRNRVVDALASPDEEILDLPIRRSELRALVHMLDYTEAVSAATGVDDFVVPFTADLTQRIGRGHDSAREHQRAIAHAIDVRQRVQEHRRQQDQEDEDGG